MKKSLTVILAFCLTLTFSFCFNLTLNKVKYVESRKQFQKPTVVLDAGHGGKDCGTVSSSGTLEKDINLAIVNKLYDFLCFSGIKTVRIRSEDTEYYPPKSNKNKSDLYNRLDFVNSIENSVLVSVHQNHYEDESQWGMQVWYTANEKSSKILADNILNSTKSLIQPDNQRENKVSDSSYYILYKATVPSVMVECGFMSNTEENLKLQDSGYQNKLSYSIMLGIEKYLSEN